jgi:transposase-like protein
LYSYFLGVSLRSISKALEPFVDRSYVAMIWYWIQEFNPSDVFPNKKKARIITAFVIDETLIQIGDTNNAWLWVAIEPIHNRILGVSISKHRNMLVAETFLKSLVNLYGKPIVYSDDGGSMVFRSLQLSKAKTYTPYTI